MTTTKERLFLINQPYLRNSEIAQLLDRSRSTISDALRRKAIQKYPPFGYLTDDIIKAFCLEGAIQRWKEEDHKIQKDKENTNG